MVSPTTLQTAQFIAQIALIGSFLFAAFQFRMHARDRRDEAALQVLTNFQSPEFRRAFGRVWSLVPDTSVATMREDPELVDAIGTVVLTFESLGVMVHNRMVPIETVDQVIGGFLRSSWERLAPYATAERDRIGSPRWGEWYQWLVERIAERRGPRRSQGAYDAFKDWRP